MSWYRVTDTIDGGHHSVEVENEEGVVFARAEGGSFLQALSLLQQVMRPTSRNPSDWWVQPLDETEEDYRMSY